MIEQCRAGADCCINSKREQKALTESDETSMDADIVVVAFNEAERIADCLRALLDQETDQKFGVIVVDDGSADDTSLIVEQFRVTDSRLRLIRHDVNRGRGAARRTGQDASHAPRIAFVDADIIVPRDWLQRCSEALIDCSAVSAVALPDGDAAVIWRIFGAAIRFRVGFSGITGNNVIFNSAVLSLEPFEAQFTLGEDFRLSQRLIRSGHKLKVLDDLSVEHRESKKYGGAIKYMWATGVDATAHPFEFRIIRLPDVSWILWLLWCLASILAGLVGWWSWTWGAVSVLGVTIVTSLTYTLSRFRVRPYPFRWLGSAFGSFPLITAYLAGRTWGLAALLSPRHRRTTGGSNIS
jgi:glycosyltransferase involved in cell wall biosynthesis